MTVMADSHLKNETNLKNRDNLVSPKKFKIVCKDNGLGAIDRTLNYIYSDKDNPVSISSPTKKIWNGGSLPLDYVKVFLSNGGPDFRTRPHWHYVTYGLSDLHGDGKVHKFTGRGQPSGFGFELTFRLNKEPEERTPPAWPVTLLNNLSLYVFKTGIKISTFDYIPWFNSIDKVEAGKIKYTFKPNFNTGINQMLVVDDPQVLSLDTPNGTVHFLQIVGVQQEEFHYSRSWKTAAIVDQLIEHPQVGPMLVTDPARKVSVFDLNPRLMLDILSKVEEEGSSLAKVTCHVLWNEIVKETDITKDVENLHIAEDSNEFHTINFVHMDFDANAGEVFPIMLRGRLKHGLSFAFINPGCCEAHDDNITIEFVPHNIKTCDNIYVSSKSPIKANKKSKYLQIYCGKLLQQKLVEGLRKTERLRENMEILPITLRLGSAVLEISIKIHKELQCKHDK